MKITCVMSHVSQVRCHVSGVTYDMSCVTCHLTPVIKTNSHSHRTSPARMKIGIKIVVTFEPTIMFFYILLYLEALESHIIALFLVEKKHTTKTVCSAVIANYNYCDRHTKFYYATLTNINFYLHENSGSVHSYTLFYMSMRRQCDVLNPFPSPSLLGKTV